MPDQEFLASFGVAADESGVNRLRQVLRENRGLAEELASAGLILGRLTEADTVSGPWLTQLLAEVRGA